MTIIHGTTPEGRPSEEGSSPMIRLQKVVVGFIRGLFAQCPPGSYHWEESGVTSQDQEGSEIWIGTETPIDPEIVAKRPAVVVGRGPAAFHGVGLGDQAYIDLKTGGHVKMDMIPTTVNVNVLAKLPMEAEEIAWFIARHLWVLRNELLRGNTFILYTGQRPSLSPPSAAGSLVSGPNTESDWIVVTVSMPVYLQHMEVAIPLNKQVLNEVVMVATATGPQPRLRPRRALVGTAVLPEEPAHRFTPPDPSSLKISATLPQNGSSEAQSTEPLTVRLKT